MNYVDFGQTRIDYNLVRDNSLNCVKLIMDPNEGFIVKAPEVLTHDRLNQLILSKAKWVLEKKFMVEELIEIPLEKEFMSGEAISYLGRNYILKTRLSKKDDVRLYRGKLIIGLTSKNNRQSGEIKNIILNWYKEKAQDRIEERINLFSKKLSLKPAKVKIKQFEKRWASCTNGNTLNFDWRIVMAPMKIIDYIVVHELCHLKITDHSKFFWDKVATILPDYENRKEWLRINGLTLNIL